MGRHVFLYLVCGRPPHDLAHDLLVLRRAEFAVGPAFGRDQIRAIVFAGSQVRLNSNLRFCVYERIPVLFALAEEMRRLLDAEDLPEASAEAIRDELDRMEQIITD